MKQPSVLMVNTTSMDQFILWIASIFDFSLDEFQGGELIHKFLPLLMSLMVDSSLHVLGNKLVDKEDTSGDDEGPIQFIDYFVEITSSNSVAFTLSWCYLLHVIKQKDR